MDFKMYRIGNEAFVKISIVCMADGGRTSFPSGPINPVLNTIMLIIL